MTLANIMARRMPAGRRLASAAALALVIGAGMVPANALQAAPGSASTDNALELSVGDSRVINLSTSMSDVIVGNPNVADVHVRSQKQLYIIAKTPGETTVFATAPNGKILYSGKIRVGNNLTNIDQMLKMAMPEADIQTATMNGMVLLTGTIKAPEDAAEAERLVQAFVGKEVTVVSRMRTATPLQVNLQVKIAEVNRNLLHKVGTNVYGLDGTAGFRGHIARAGRQFVTAGTNGTLQFANQPSDNSTTLGFVAKMFGVDVAGALDLAETSGLATLLAQPNLTSLSGETAGFLAGGEYPYQVTNGTLGNSIEFKQYGVQLSFTPTVLSDGRISMRVRPTVSSLDFSINSAIPALKTRSAETTVELGSGQAFMIAGLLTGDTANNIDKVPGLGNIPVLGSLFKSRSFQRNETELVIVVTPYLVKPMNAGDVRLPTDGFRSATEAQGFFNQQSSDGVSGDKRPEPTLAPSAPGPVAGNQAPAAPAIQDRRKPTKSADAAAPGFSF
ncbi:MAG: type II and III secretion system protein family protein [Sphingobium phenoxybenzoativorans]